MDRIKEIVANNWQKFVAWAAVAAVTYIATRLGYLPTDTPIPPPPPPVFEPTDAQSNAGWHKDDEAVQAVAATLAFKAFADTPAGQNADPLPAEVYLWQAYRKLFARGPPSKNQADVGSCVSFGTNTAIERTLAAQIVTAGGNADEFRHIVEEVTYGGSRVEIGGGRIRGDGSVGAWAAQFVQKWGIVSRETHGAHNLSIYSVPRCREFGDKGVPDDLEGIARERPIKDITQVKTWAEAKRALASGYGIAICSDQGFAMQRDANGVCRAAGSWAHCMALDGYCSINGKEHGHIVNSWGPTAHTGPVGLGDPPPCGFWADSATIGRMLAQNDSWAFSAVKGWPTRKLNWFVQRERFQPANLLGGLSCSKEPCNAKSL